MRGRFVKESSRLLCTLHFSLYYIFIWLKMYEQQFEAEEQLKTAVFGNWRKEVLAMGGATCVGGIVSMANTFPVASALLASHSIL